MDLVGGPAWDRAVAAQLRAERAARGITLQDTATRSGVSKATIMRMESGKRRPDTYQLACLSRAYEVGVSEILARAEQRMAADDDPIAAELLAGMSPRARAEAEKVRSVPEKRVKRAP